MIEKRLFYKMQVSKITLSLLSIIIFILFTVIATGIYLLLSSNTLDNQNEALFSKEDSNNPAIYKAPLNNMILNVRNNKGRAKLMKLSFAIKSSEPMIQQVVEDNREIIMDKVILLISTRRTDELLTVGGKVLFKEELRDEMNIVLNKATIENEDLQKDMVHKILYTSFVIK